MTDKPGFKFIPEEAAFTLTPDTILDETIAALAHAQEEVDQGRKVLDSLVALFPEIDRVTMCPACADGAILPVWQCVTHLNDHHQWTREKVADWLDSLNPHV